MQRPSFSSTLLERIYRSMDEEADAIPSDPKSLQQDCNCIIAARPWRVDQEPSGDEILRACLVGDEKKILEHDLLFSSKSSSSFSGSSSTSDVESIGSGRWSRLTLSSFLIPPSRATNFVSATRLEKSSRLEKFMGNYRQRTLKRTSLSERPRTSKPPLIDAYEAQASARLQIDGSSVAKPKQRPLKIYETIKKVKQPVSPGGLLSSFIDSLFAAAGNAKKLKSSLRSNKKGSPVLAAAEQKGRHGSATRRTVRFSPTPVSLVMPEDLKPYRHNRCLYDLPNYRSSLTLAAALSNRKARRSPPVGRKLREDAHAWSVEKVEREFIRDYYRNHKRCRSREWESYRSFGGCSHHIAHDNDEKEQDEYKWSCSSSDLFELDHPRYSEELPVHETTRVRKNIAIVDELMMMV
ncbi:hypothetical protein SAY87_006723 [Trapa incisa]|uniref:Protein BIG GRAIN 1-like A n=1 Tax=Trapa incisa TaxID=236973 RepID=A0AAN7JZ43_9MYRT|nr:hypothetical protein SAY87_006723 [Trapa incisa]